ncbi:MAG TPA: hypothetical protein VHM93_06615, partial [Candidatus Acidoferrum sp.]|nr:hypothetical protein [Candidatus Acidoferrum sp.]
MILLALHGRQITPAAWMMPLRIIPVPNPVLGVGDFSLSLKDYSCQAPTVVSIQIVFRRNPIYLIDTLVLVVSGKVLYRTPLNRTLHPYSAQTLASDSRSYTV